MSFEALLADETGCRTGPAPPSQLSLWRHYHQLGPGSETENELIKEYLPLVKSIVGRIAITLPAHVDREDLHSAGLVGLLNALRRYDPACGAAFETYARVRIRGAVLDELRRVDWIPRSVHSKARKVEETMRQLEQANGEIPTETDMARALKISLGEYRQLLSDIQPAAFVCLDSVRTREAEDRGTHYEGVADDHQPDPGEDASRGELTRLIAERIEQLPEMQRKVLALYYFEDLRLREIAEVYGVTESRVCQIHAQAIQAIKAALRKQDPLTV